MSYDGSTGKSPVEIMFIEELEGSSCMRRQGLVLIFWAVGGVIAIVPLSIKPWIITEGLTDIGIVLWDIHVIAATGILVITLRWRANIGLRLYSSSEISVPKLVLKLRQWFR